ncbi:hypothetical protein SEUCBS140593_006343 [Sporothrix eucalyptigena]|uniref:Major facilitator superfamily (MFS) profile domain-containing protein n=1 Tax=Sporothrix eucalyptigena TaxID=1812306 RepID=A0ABP0C4F6_9PEZI
MGFLIATCQTYISEITSPKIRGPLLGLYTFMSTVGQIISITIIFKRVAILDISSFEVPFATQWIFSGLCMVAAIIIPESPVYLLSKSRVEAAEAAYRRLHGSNVDSHAAIRRLWATVEHEQEIARNAKSVSFFDCFKGIDMRRTRIILILNAIPQFCGIAIIANGTYYMELCGMNATESFQLAEIGIGLLMASTVISWFAISTIGRRLIIIVSPAVVGLLYMGMGIAGTFPVTGKSAWGVGVMLILVCFSYGCGLGTAFPVTATEVSSVRLRAKSSGLGFFMNAFSAWVFAFVSPYLYSPGAGNAKLGAKTGFVFMGLSFLASIIAYFVVPETKGLSFSQIDYLFENKTRAQDFLKPESLAGFAEIPDSKVDLDNEEAV